ncbi:MAG: TIGR03619 family F420-dependent LLM class oxidoreductase [Candidatus Nanopelagicales bacterium]
MKPKLVSVLTENWTMTDPRDVRGIVRMAQEAEDAGFDMIMISDHVLLGPSAGSEGRMENPRDYAMPGNQDPATEWPSSIVMLSAIAAATTRIRVGGIALIAPLRHPLALAKDLATLDLLAEGRLVIQPTVSWHKDEYDALGVPFGKRGKILDEDLEIWSRVWAESPASFHGEFFDFTDVYIDPKPCTPKGPAMWFGGESLTDPVLNRLVKYGSGYHPLGRPKADDVAKLRAGLEAAGRSIEEIEMVGGTRVEFPDAHSVAPLPEALEGIPAQLEMGFGTFCIKPSIFIDERDRHAEFCREVVRRVDELTA